MYKTGLLIIAGLLLFSGSCFGAQAEVGQKWKIGHVRPVGSAIDKDIHWLTQEISAATKGRITFEIYANNRLGDYSVVQERISFGDVEMFVGPLGTTTDKRLALAFTPYLVNSWEEAKKIYIHDSLLLRKMAELLAAQNIKLLGGWPVYFGGIVLNTEPVEPGNPDLNKGMILRIPPIRPFELTARELGYTPYPITWTYARMGLKTGLVAGMIGGGAEGYVGLKGLVKYYLPIRDHFEYWFVTISQDAWRGLNEQEQKFVEKRVREMETRRYAVAESEEQANIERLRNQGVTIVTLGEEEMVKTREKIRTKVWPVLQKEIGPDFDEVVTEAGKR